MDVNLFLIQTPSSEMFQNMDTFLILISLTNDIQFNEHSQMASLSPSPDKIMSHPQMASLSPSPNGIFKPIPSNYALTSANFLGTLVSNLLLPSSRERKTCQSNSSGSRRLNRGNCCTPKFALSFPQEITASGFSWFFRLAQESVKQTFLVSQTKLGFPLI